MRNLNKEELQRIDTEKEKQRLLNAARAREILLSLQKQIAASQVSYITTATRK